MSALGTAPEVTRRGTAALDAYFANPTDEAMLAFGVATYTDGYDQAIADFADLLADLGMPVAVVEGFRLAALACRLEGVEP